ncbi:MAG: hypothetical protein IPL61_05080 [Myxococcales bacterium]|nr:hypothetical protein [Myxococcales bacterium]
MKHPIPVLVALALAAPAIPSAHADDPTSAPADAPADTPAAAPAAAADAEAAAADAEAAAEAAADAEAVAAAHEQKKAAKTAAKRKKGDDLKVTGRVFARGAAAAEETALGPGAWVSELTLASARIGVEYQWHEQVKAEVTFEAARGSVRDAYVELDLDHGLRVRAGRMKLPVGAVETTSSWTLPTIGRGMVADVLADGLGATGRRSAVELRWRGHGPWRPTVTAAVAQGVRTIGGQQPGLVADGGALTVAARAAVEPSSTASVAVVGASRVVNYGSAVGRYWNVGLEVEVDLAAVGAGLRLWGDAIYGTSHVGVAQLGDADRPFAAAELVAGYRLGGHARNARYFEPYLGLGWLNPVADRARDDATEITVGVAGGLWRRWRAQGQFAYQNARSLRPAGLLGTADINDKQTISVQLGTAF